MTTTCELKDQRIKAINHLTIDMHGDRAVLSMHNTCDDRIRVYGELNYVPDRFLIAALIMPITKLNLLCTGVDDNIICSVVITARA